MDIGSIITIIVGSGIFSGLVSAFAGYLSQKHNRDLQVKNQNRVEDKEIIDGIKHTSYKIVELVVSSDFTDCSKKELIYHQYNSELKSELSDLSLKSYPSVISQFNKFKQKTDIFDNNSIEMAYSSITDMLDPIKQHYNSLYRKCIKEIKKS